MSFGEWQQVETGLLGKASAGSKVADSAMPSRHSMCTDKLPMPASVEVPRYYYPGLRACLL